MKEILETAIKSIGANSKIPMLDEASTRVEVIDPVLDRLGWDRYSEYFKREFPVSGGRVDYALLVDDSPTVFIEAKRPCEDLKSHQDQLVSYCAKSGVQLAVLTNGLEWRFYLRPQKGNAEEQQFCELRISEEMSERQISSTAELLIKFLSRERIYSGKVVSDAEDILVQRQNDNKVKVRDALARTWTILKDGLDAQRIKLFYDKVKDLCGLRAGTNQNRESQEAAKAEYRASLQPTVFTINPNSRCPDSQPSHSSRGAATVPESDSNGKSVVIVGKQGTGKTTMARYFAGMFPPGRIAVWDPMEEYKVGSGIYVPKDRQDKNELSQWLASTLPLDGMSSSRFEGVIVDAAPLCFPQNKTEMRRYPEIEKFVNLHRQFGVTFIMIGMRPAHFSPDVREMASEIVVFQLTGPNDARMLDSLADGMGSDAASLPPFHHLIYRDGNYEHCSPIEISEVKG